MCKIEKVVFLCKIDGKFAWADVVAIRRDGGSENMIENKSLI